MALTGQFYLHPVLDAEKSETAGRKIFKDVLYVEIRAKGDKNASFSCPATNEHKRDFHAAYQRYLAENGGEEEGHVGTPLRCLPAAGPSVILELKASGIFCLEDLLDIDDVQIDKIRGGRMLQTQARAYLAAAAATQGEAMQHFDESQGDDAGTASDSFIDDLTGEQTAKRSPGRPRKAEAA